MWVVPLPLASWVSGPGDLLTVNKGSLEGWEGGPLWEGKAAPASPTTTHLLLLFSCQVVSDTLQPMGCSTPSLPVPHHLPEFSKFMSLESVMPSNHLSLCRPLLLRSLIFPSIRVFSNESALHIKWPKYWSFSFSISLSIEYSGLI